MVFIQDGRSIKRWYYNIWENWSIDVDKSEIAERTIISVVLKSSDEMGDFCVHVSAAVLRDSSI